MTIKPNPLYNPISGDLSRKYQGIYIMPDITKSIVVFGWSRERVLKKLLLAVFSNNI